MKKLDSKLTDLRVHVKQLSSVGKDGKENVTPEKIAKNAKEIRKNCIEIFKLITEIEACHKYAPKSKTKK